MNDDLVNAKEFRGTRVVRGENSKPVGKVRYCVFHPKKKQCMGFMVKRPDAALMFRRKDVFVALDSYEFEGKNIKIDDTPDATDAAAAKRLGVNLDECIIWEGMPIIAENGDQIAWVDDVCFDVETGKVEQVIPHATAGAKFLIGLRTIPRNCIKGFRFGVGDELNITEGEGDEEEMVRGAIVVSNKALTIQTEGGIAEKAGQQSAIAAEKVRQASAKAKPAVDAAGKAAEEAVEKGAFVTGRQIGRAKGMFGAFVEEYEKAVSDTPKAKKSGKATASSSAKKSSKNVKKG